MDKMKTGRFEVARKKQSNNSKREFTKDISYKKLIRNTAICAAILLGIAVLSGVDGAVAPAAKSKLATDGDLGRLRFVSASPVEGEIIETFASTGEEVVIEAEVRDPVYAMADGVVYETAHTTMVLKNGNGTLTTYEGVVPGKKAGETVSSGEIIGQVANGQLTLTTVSGTGYVDSLSASDLERDPA